LVLKTKTSLVCSLDFIPHASKNRLETREIKPTGSPPTLPKIEPDFAYSLQDKIILTSKVYKLTG